MNLSRCFFDELILDESLRDDSIQPLRAEDIPPAADFIHGYTVIWMRRTRKESEMAKNLLLEYSEELATKCELLCKSISGNSNTLFQLKKSSSGVFANISEAQYPQSLPDMLSKFEIARKEYMETESWLKLLLSSSDIDDIVFKKYRNLCGRIRRMLTSSCITIENKINKKSREIYGFLLSILFICCFKTRFIYCDKERSSYSAFSFNFAKISLSIVILIFSFNCFKTITS